MPSRHEGTRKRGKPGSFSQREESNERIRPSKRQARSVEPADKHAYDASDKEEDEEDYYAGEDGEDEDEDEDDEDKDDEDEDEKDEEDEDEDDDEGDSERNKNNDDSGNGAAIAVVAGSSIPKQTRTHQPPPSRAKSTRVRKRTLKQVMSGRLFTISILRVLTSYVKDEENELRRQKDITRFKKNYKKLAKGDALIIQ
jgi:cobalamin biosynthesis protein CobT